MDNRNPRTNNNTSRPSNDGRAHSQTEPLRPANTRNNPNGNNAPGINGHYPAVQRRNEQGNPYANSQRSHRPPAKRRRRNNIGRYILRGVGCFFTLIGMLVLTVYISLGLLCTNNSEIKFTTVPTFLETGAFKWIPSLYLSSDDINEIVNENKMADISADVDTGMIQIGSGTKSGVLDIDINGEMADSSTIPGDSGEPIEVHEISGATYFGTMIVVKDPSRVSLATIYPWRESGVTLEELVQQSGAIGGINGGLYNSNGNTGGQPYGVIVCNGEIQHNDPSWYQGLYLIGFTEDDILQIIDIDGKSPAEIEDIIRKNRIRDAVSFQDEATDANNHFVPLIINGEAREMNGMGSGLNPRTVIGQRADGSVLMFVTDGRGKSGHLGASAADLIEVMQEYGAVNAANLDGGSSSCMYYDGEYKMTSVTFYYTNSSWKLPAGFIIK